MTPIAAYYLLITTDQDRDRAQRTDRSRPVAARPSRSTRVVTALETLVRLGRPATTQPI